MEIIVIKVDFTRYVKDLFLNNSLPLDSKYLVHKAFVSNSK